MIRRGGISNGSGNGEGERVFVVVVGGKGDGSRVSANRGSSESDGEGITGARSDRVVEGLSNSEAGRYAQPGAGQVCRTVVLDGEGAYDGPCILQGNAEVGVIPRFRESSPDAIAAPFPSTVISGLPSV